MINEIPQKEYRHRAKDRKDLIRQGFEYSFFYDGFIYRFPVYKHNYKTVLECQFVIYKGYDEFEHEILNPKVQIDVINIHTNGFYPPFYEYNNGYKQLVEMINVKIINKLQELQIKSVKRKKVN